MTEINPLFPQYDLAAERRRALAKVYSLLIKLAEEAENKATSQTVTKTEEAKAADLEAGVDGSEAK
jgi:hypothetical protein